MNGVPPCSQNRCADASAVACICVTITKSAATAPAAPNRHMTGSGVATRLGIELTGDVWRVVELEGRRSWRPGRPDSVVRSCIDVPAGDGRARLAAARGRAASVVVWGVPSRHRQVMVNSGTYEAMRDEARVTLDA